MATYSPLATCKPFGESAGLVTGAVGAMHVVNREAERLIALDARARDLPRLIGGIIKHLNFQKLARVIEARDGFHEPLDHVALVENGKLNRHHRPVRHFRRRRRKILAVFIKIVDQPIAVQAVHRQHDQNEEIRNHHREVKAIDLIHVAERIAVPIGLAMPIVPQRVPLQPKERRDVRSFPHGCCLRMRA